MRPDSTRPLANRFSLVVVTWVSLVAITALAEERILTVSETLGGIFAGGSSAIAAAKAGNPAAKPILYKLLDKPQMKDYQKTIYLMLGHMGEKQDAFALERRLKTNYVGLLSLAEWSAVDSIFWALSTMATRGVPEAGTIIRQMTEPTYWRDMKFQAGINSPLGTTNELIIRALLAYARSGAPDWEIKVRSFKDSVLDSKMGSELEWRLNVTNVSQHVREFQMAKVATISPEMRKLLPQLFNGDMENPGPATDIKVPRRPVEAEDDTPPEVTVVKTLNPQEVESLKPQALNAFDRTLDALLHERYEQLALTVARRGEPLVPIAGKDEKMIPRAIEELKRISANGGFEFTKRLIKDLNPQTSRHGEATGEVLSDGTTVIRIPCLGSEPIKAKHLPGIGSDLSPTINKDGQLSIYMLKQENYWYWNPFGW